ncbi:hypothetical protein [Salinimicrobium flavum]|uniref:EF-hand domain-containing protein n=1 Tax=Salinimicrobium flavum TaxID=1737065 RepID=A0ABW5IRX7_9FLAO
MKKILSFLCLCLLCISCVDEIQRPIASGTPEENNSENLLIANLPVHIDSTNYLIHPVGQIEVRERGYFGSSSGSSGSTSVGDEIYGNFTNLRFQELNSEEFTGLTDQDVRILSVEFLREIFDNTGKQLLLYKIVDIDTNADGKLNSNDHTALYISGINGSDLRKISPADQVLQEYNVLQAMNRLYFRSTEDRNANDRFDPGGKPYYFYVDLASEALKVTEYFPLENRKK